ncbi:hypothetical protein HH310_06245 [Actinoplanes sp. TBRC 11911]|uniref:hypothetical protein n=1 Tax=Actinoplanes sp. TBRC 11911 TaxID=2729386 RepID=UPI00145E1FE1|nr:hypothetical protein [Actinoplanes sp. TBRC 11911]NMO50792.1 hypothetical protein [Actinoplanes sp. TBRC 11911]
MAIQSVALGPVTTETRWTAKRGSRVTSEVTSGVGSAATTSPRMARASAAPAA